MKLTNVLSATAAALVAGAYVRPFAEYSECTSDFQIIAMAAQRNLRPTLSGETPSLLRDLIHRAWLPNDTLRPTAAQLCAQLTHITTLRRTERRRRR